MAQSVTTTGYGDYTPTHQVSRGVAIALVVLGLVITTVWVAQIHSASSEMGRQIIRRRLKEQGQIKKGLEIEELAQVRRRIGGGGASSFISPHLAYRAVCHTSVAPPPLPLPHPPPHQS